MAKRVGLERGGGISDRKGLDADGTRLEEVHPLAPAFERSERERQWRTAHPKWTTAADHATWTAGRWIWWTTWGDERETHPDPQERLLRSGSRAAPGSFQIGKSIKVRQWRDPQKSAQDQMMGDGLGRKRGTAGLGGKDDLVEIRKGEETKGNNDARRTRGLGVPEGDDRGTRGVKSRGILGREQDGVEKIGERTDRSLGHRP
ncbi:hypothetical protein B0H16DRAFT_1471834 [Mycena metata]|uniref:Uncharacterized protein n=1 Tax=Mycena metata TaxID=1033252 RepID=A0AAD7MNA3_9AGAR|nr:hypothetical protein B0H16DRAFT_1471834 [Mycena metata]